MKIKDIAQFRTYYRNMIPARRNTEGINEHFIGSYNDELTQGFFAFCNGDKQNDEIGSFLKSFLDMAKDTQAIYEFLQNAVDANSTKFLMFYDEEYLMVINNGEPFSYEGVRSILNVGQSTKANDEHTIGKFGIGFKLVHRLVGESSGIEELETGQVGPIVFSWYENTNAINDLIGVKTSEDLESVKIEMTKAFRPIEGTKLRKHECLTTFPWLFKILLTSFPCQPNDYGVYDINYKETKNDADLLFKEQEIVNVINYFKKWVKDERIIQELNETSGSLFFLKLGKGKHKLLEDNDLEKGVQISLSILNELTKKDTSISKELKDVIINDKSEIKALELEFEKFTISPTDPEYLSIYPAGKAEKEKVDIELLFGFCKDYKDAVNIIEKYANFYLFFPLSQEAHGFNFIIHCNAFHNGSQRTNLHVKGEDGRNEILFKRFTTELISRLENYKNQEIVNERFYEIYIALLLSKKPKEERNKWLYEPLYQPLENYLKINIPTNQGFAAESKYVKVKNSNLSIESPKDWGCQEYHWFKWSDKEVDKDIINTVKRGATSYRLDSWSIKELIVNTTSVEAINNWLLSLDNDYQLFFSELNDAIVDFKETEEEDEQKFKDNLQKIKLPFENGFYSIDEINNLENNLFLLDNDTIGIQEQLKKLSFKLSSFNLSEYSNLDNFYRKHIEYLADSDLLLKKINAKTSNEELNKSLLATDKELVIKSFSKKLDKDKRSKLNLFKNKNEIKPTIQLIKNSNATSWLDKFKIQDGYETITNDLDFTESSNIYHEFIFKLWSEIIVHPDIHIDTDIFYHQVNEYYKHETHHYYRLKEGEELNFIYGTNNQFNKVTEIFYRSELSKVTDYTAIKSAIQKLINKPVPSKKILGYISEPKSAFHLPNIEKEKENFLTSLKDENIGKLEPNERFAVYELVKQFDEEKAKQIKLFYDSNKTPKASKDLLKPDKNRPSYIKSFEIHQDFKQYAGELSFMPDTLVYDNIILTNWENITEYFIKTEPTNNEVVKFYEYIKSLFTEKDSKSLKAAGKAFIYTNNQGFELREAVFYNKNTALAQAEDVIEKLTSKDFPISEIMSYLSADSASPFAIPTENSITKDNLKSNILLSKSEVENLLDFCLKNGKERIFDIGYFKYQSSNNTYYFHTANPNVQFYTKIEELKNYVKEQYADDYHLLEKTFKPEYYQLGLLNKDQIVEQIIKRLATIKELNNRLELIYDFIDIIIRKDSIDTDLKEKYVNLIKRLDFDSKGKYSINSFEYKFLKLALWVIKNKTSSSSKDETDKDNLIKALRAKVYIDDKPLINLKVLKKFKLKLNDQFSIEISPTDIIPISDNSQLIRTISNQFKDEKGNDDRELKENIFIEVDKDETSTFNDFKKQENKVIDTFEKFIFISYKEKKPLNTIEDYKIESLNSIDILKCFYQNIFKPNFKSTKESDTNKLPLWLKNYFGYNKENYVFHRWAVQEELLPNDILSWAKTNQEEKGIKESFLHNLGINTTKSNIITFRDRLDRNNRINETQYNTIKGALQNEKKLLNNTLVWYSNRVKGQKLNRQKNNTSLDILKDIYENITIDTSTILPWITEVNGTDISIELNQYNTETTPTVFYNLQSEDKKRWQIIFETLTSKGHVLIANELLSNVDFIENGQEIKLIPTIDKIEPQVAKDWDTEHYKLWKNSDINNPTIKIYQDEIPYVDTFLGEVVSVSVNEKNDNDGYFDTENNIIYISEKCQNFEDKLRGLLGSEKYNDLKIFKEIQKLKEHIRLNSEKKSFKDFNLLGEPIRIKDYVLKWLQKQNVQLTNEDDRLSLISEMLKYQNQYSKDLPLLLIKLENEEVFYYLDVWNEKTVYSFETLVSRDKQDAYNILKSKNRQMIDREYCYVDFEEIDNKNEIIKSKVDENTLEEIGKLWDSPFYEDWDCKNEYLVYLINQGIPQQDFFFEILFKDTYPSNKNEFDKDNKVYLNMNFYSDDDKIIQHLKGIINDNDKWEKLFKRYENEVITGERATFIRENGISLEELKAIVEKRPKLPYYDYYGGGYTSLSSSTSNNKTTNKNIKSIGNRGEKFIHKKLKQKEFPDILLKRWMNEEHIERGGIHTQKDESSPYDFLVEVNKIKGYIDCKSTTYTEPTFYLSHNEWKHYLKARKNNEPYIIFRVFNLDTGNPSYFRFDDLITSIEKGDLVPYLEENKDIGIKTVWLSVKEHMKTINQQ